MTIHSGEMSQSAYVLEILFRDIRNIFQAQLLIVSQRVYLSGKDLKASRRKKGIERQSGALENALISPNYVLQAEGEKFTLAASYPIHIRFLDMKEKGNWKIYNRVIWGILYNNAMKDIKFRYGDTVADQVGNALRQAFEKYNEK